MGVLFEYHPIARDVNSIKDKPLVSIVLTSYKQKDLSGIALMSLLEQDYDHLEVVITDDCSKDGSVECLLNLCKKYSQKGGKHSVIFNVNDNNLGGTKNYERGFKLSHGELIVTAGGDDISYPYRVSRIVEKWLAGGKAATVIYHKLRPVDVGGKPLDYEWWQMTLRNPLGAAMAYSRVVITNYPEITIGDGFEDSIFARRAFLLGEQLFIDDALIDYRVGSGVTSSGDIRTKRKNISRGMSASVVQDRIDIDYVRATVQKDKIKELETLIDEVEHTYSVEYQMIEGPNISSRINAFVCYVKCPNRLYPPTVANVLKHYVPLMFPHMSTPSIVVYKTLRIILRPLISIRDMARNRRSSSMFSPDRNEAVK